ncbi:hypothetical protein HAT2_00055 [Candidatus Similichlamydia laticola]|uniref:Uncharacterized protein n=1 Tax=Candidatus Similichlamydia laticola TaxID=2170265 RepID=A0A369KGK6_9BACT|nr:hypothetical protein HAT2_00055 [Candidatus Similichlamydia laticola]
MHVGQQMLFRGQFWLVGIDPTGSERLLLTGGVADTDWNGQEV